MACHIRSAHTEKLRAAQEKVVTREPIKTAELVLIMSIQTWRSSLEICFYVSTVRHDGHARIEARHEFRATIGSRRCGIRAGGLRLGNIS
jgi:hypothetical protein